jgi:hypothetical protein
MITIDTEGVFHFDTLGRILTEDRHHVQEILKGEVTIIRRGEDFANPVFEWVDLNAR